MQVKVWNDNIHPYSEQFRDTLIKIPAKGFILMEAGEALLFKGTFAPIKVDADGNPIPEGFKMIRVEETAAEVDAPKVSKEPTCQACGYKAASEKDLSEHVEANHKHQMVVDEDAEREIAKRKSTSRKAG